ncbi:hypothetical protein EXIGLDRAFT_84425 [Exidia glandulosa HHB12029]|uniref:AAA-ATPase-like domain-containing protein n=1 Tax=Exidia glandulosa HHB12029 TaxID=1314781 RepID=A0A165HI48_EXIGL|nr:hypothetical protein EXIGLDRAFT_84425 [Exidia glandulosa HHB12029]
MLIDLSTPVLEIYDGGESPPDCVHIMFGFEPDSQGVTSPSPPPFNVRRLEGNVCCVGSSLNPDRRLPTNSHFDQFIRIPGTHYVDDSDFIGTWFIYGNCLAIPIIRRPPGFGKSTLLSMVAVYFSTSYKYRDLPRQRVSLPSYPQNLLVLRLDFKDLSHRLQVPNDNALENQEQDDQRIVDEFLSATFQTFYVHHRQILTAAARDRQQPNRIHRDLDLEHDEWFSRWHGFKSFIVLRAVGAGVMWLPHICCGGRLYRALHRHADPEALEHLRVYSAIYHLAHSLRTGRLRVARHDGRHRTGRHERQ